MSAEDNELILQCIQYGNEELLRELIDANPSSASFSQSDASSGGISPLHLAATKGFCGCMKILLSTKCDVDVLSSPQTALKTPLLMASESGHDKAVEILLDAGADIFYTDVNGHSALQLAQMQGHSNTVKVLVSNLDKIHTTSGIMRDELIQAIIDGDVGTVYRILAEMPKQCRQRITNGNTTDEKSALYLACEHGRTDIVDALMTLPGHIIIYSVSGDNVLHAAVASQNYETVEIILKKFPFLMDAPNNDGNLPLHWACQNGNFEIVKLMLELEFPEDEMKYFEDNRGIQTYKFICDLNAADFECRTPFYLAVVNGHTSVVHFLVNFKLELFHNDKEPCIGNPLAFNIYCSNGRTALMMACANGSEEIVRILLDNEVDVNLPIALTEQEIRQLHPNEEMRCAGSGALVEAAKSGHIRIIKLLLRKGAIDYDNRALTAAVKTGKIDEISVFLNQLAFVDNEYRVNKKAAYDSTFSAAVGGSHVLNSSNLLANIFPSTSVQLNWHGAALETLTTEWLTSAALKFNARLRHSRLALTAITRLDLSFNRLTEIPAVIYQLQSLYILDLSQNLIQIIETPPNTSHLPCLENLNLEANYIQTLPALLFSKTCPNLKNLNVAGNRLRIVPNFIWTAPKLKEINLSSNEIIEISTVWMMQQQQQHQQRRSAKASHQERIESRATRIRSKHSGTSSALALASASATKVKESPRKGNIKEHDIIRLNAWQKKIQLSNIDDLDYVDEVPETVGDIFSNSLRTLNLSSNKLKVMPTCLACCCPKLTRLDLSMNEITSLGPLECLPSSLRHLNLCHNRLIKIFTRAESADLLCQAPSLQTPSDSRQQQRPSLGGNRHSRSRSRSVARNQRSLSVVRTSDGERIALSEVCPHKSHCRFEALKTLNLSYNEISQFDLFVPFGFTNDFNSIDQFNLNLKQNSQQMRSYLIFPALTNLDISYNALKSLPATVSLLSSLAALNVSGNRDLDSLPYELGLLDKLWNISLKDCPVKEPLKSIVNAENYKTVELIAFLRNKLENSKPYNKLKLLILGGPGVGKTQLLQQIRAEGNVSKKNLQSESWSRRLGHNFTTNAIKVLSSKSIQISTGVDVAEWSFEPKKGSKNSPESLGPITFRTWDFDGKMKEYATICQYFFSRRAIYIVLWKATDGDIALNEIHEWLLFIQSRAPNSTVIIVGTHFDAVEENLQRFPKDYLETLYRSIQERFVNIPDSDKKGLPRVVASIFVSLKSKHNMRSLCNLLYQTAADLKTFGRKQKLLTQKIPSIYLALEVITVTLIDELRAKGSEPIMKFNDFWIYASGRIGEEFGRPFRDITEFRQALLFLHENGVIIYFEDSSLGEFCFLDPPWLYSALSSIISTKGGSSNAHENAITTNTDINAIVKQFINHSTTDSSRRSLLKQCIFRLLYRLEAALPCQNKLLIISSALPDEYLLRADYPGAKIKFKTKLSSFHLRWKPPTMTASMSPTKKPSFFHRKIVRTLANKHFEEKDSAVSADSGMTSVPKLKLQQPSIDKKIYVSQHPKKNLRRLFSMQYVPPGFWARLITRILDDEKVTSAISKLFVVHSSEGTPLSSARRRSSSPHNSGADTTTMDPSTAYLSDLINKEGFEWLLWKSGLEINAFGTFILSVKHFLPLASVRDVNYSMTELQKKSEDGQWRQYKLDQTFLVELLIPHFNVRIQLSDGREFILEQDEMVAARLLAVFVNIIDDLLEDWFPALGTRFVHTSEGRLLVDRLIPCPDCAYHERNALKSQKSMDLNNPDIFHSGQFPPKSQTMDNFVVISKSIIYLFTVEECILQARGFSPATKDTNFGTVICPMHEQIAVEQVAPEVSFKDLPFDLVLNDDGIKRGKLMGRGAFGFVFSGFVRKKQNEAFNEVALKVLEPIEPGIGAKGSAQAAFEAFILKWKNDALENCARSYCTARQELNMLTDLQHPHIPTLIGFCARPMTIAVELAPLGALDSILAKYRRVDARLTVDTLQQVCIQIAKAIEYLHTSKIIFRDLKSENVLVWRFPLPRAIGDVRVKLGDYGISRFSYPSGVCKGYGGTEGFMAPEIMRANGEQEYNEKVDCFSFGMFVYELISLKQPYDGQEQMKDFILDGGRPFLSDKELLIPSNVLDLMVTCWSEDSDLRPTAAQLVSLTTAPEFGHLLDVSLLDEHTKAKLGTLVSLPPESLSSATVSSGGNNSNCWLQKDDSEWIILSCSPYGWLECRTLALSHRPRTTITAICAIDENTIWLSDTSGIIRVMSNSTLEELNRFSIVDLEASFASGDTGIYGIQVFAERQTALITLLHSILICICAGAEKPIFLSSIELAEKIYVTSFLPAHGNWQILTGHDNAKMIVHHINGTKTQLIYSASVTHSSPTKLRTTDFKEALPETAAVKFIVTSRTNTNFVWSSLDGGSSIYFWDNCCLRRTLDCRKILPSSESLSSMSIESIRDATISALCVLASDHLLLGTTAGLLIVLDGKELTPLAAFRSFSSSIDLILPVLCQSFSLPLNQREPSLQSLNSLSSFSPQDFQDRQKVESDSGSINSTESGVVNDYLLDAVSKVKSMFVSGKSEKSSSNLFEESYFVAIGHGYRPLIDRFSSAEAISDSESSQKCAVVFRAGDWI